MRNAFQREVAAFWTQETGVIGITTSNSAGHVEFDWFKIWPTIKACVPRPKLAVMLHTHPPGVTAMSATDRNMVYGWCLALGIPVRFIVICEELCHDYLCHLQDGEFNILDLGTVNEMLLDTLYRYSYQAEVLPEHIE